MYDIELYNIPNENNMYSHRLFVLFDLYFNRAKNQQKSSRKKKKLIQVIREVRWEIAYYSKFE